MDQNQMKDRERGLKSEEIYKNQMLIRDMPSAGRRNIGHPRR